MKNRNEVLDEVYRSDIIQKMANKYAATIQNNMDDFISHCALLLCELPEEKLMKLYNKGELYFYVVKVCSNQAWNLSSTFHKQITNNLKTVPLNENAEVLEDDTLY